MAFELKELADFDTLPFDQIVDVRSPSEYALDHLPGAINLPVLDDKERALIGTIYVQTSRFQARKLGAALVAKNAAKHLEGALADQNGSYQPLVYCWRGGQRSGSFASILAQIGWRVQVLNGGYRSYRQLVARALYEDTFPAPLFVLAGNTGTAKTEILHRLRNPAMQVIDLEGLANHRGSLFGARPGGQPSQKAFESLLAKEISELDRTKPVVVEAESSKIGQLYVPPGLWQAMGNAPRITIEAPLPERAKYLTHAYQDLLEHPDNLLNIIDKLRPIHAAEKIDAWLEFAKKGAHQELATALMQHHYDPRYAKKGAVKPNQTGPVIALADLSEKSLDKAANALVKKIENQGR